MAMHLGCAGSQGCGAPPARTAVPATDIHAHYYSQGHFDFINAERARFNAHFTTDGRTFSFKTPAATNGGLPMKFIDLQQRLAEMDVPGVAVQALSLTPARNLPRSSRPGLCLGQRCA